MKEKEWEEKWRSKMERLRHEKEVREKGLVDVYGKISEKKRQKRIEEEKLAKQLKDLKLQRMYKNASKAMVEEKAWTDLVNGAERVAAYNQDKALVDQYKQNWIKVKDLTQMAKNGYNTVMAHVEYDQGYTQWVSLKKTENELIHKNDLHYKSKMYTKQRSQEDNLWDTTAKWLPFNAKINTMNRDNAK